MLTTMAPVPLWLGALLMLTAGVASQGRISREKHVTEMCFSREGARDSSMIWVDFYKLGTAKNSQMSSEVSERKSSKRR